MPIKLDTGTEIWQTWARKHKAEGKGIPIVYVVRADGETLYANSGTLTDNQLKILLTAAMNNAGMVLGEKDVQTLTEVTSQFRQFRLNGDPKSALKSLKQAKRYLGKTGQVGSYAKPATDLNEEIQLLVQSARDSISQVASQIEKAKDQSESEQIRAIQKYLGVKDQYSDLRSSKSDLSRIQSNLRKNEQMKSLYESVRLLEMAASAKSASQKKRYRDKLEKLAETTPFPLIKSEATAILERLQD
ncbi:MAG: hypothetical protein MK108_16360 [Mariniblastus sp.]|nr:hypothetical protein [Mariniblastus sp.]